MKIEIGKTYVRRWDNPKGTDVQVIGFADLFSDDDSDGQIVIYEWIDDPAHKKARTVKSFKEKYEPLHKALDGWNSFHTFPKDGKFYLVAYDPEVRSTKLAFSELRWDHDREQFLDCTGAASEYEMHSWLPIEP